MTNIIRNAIKCLECGDIIVSRHRHDWVQCSCGSCFVDGGHDYFRYCGVRDKIESMVVTDEDDHELIRDALEWGTYGKNGDEPFHYIKLKDMETAHIKAIIDDGYELEDYTIKAFNDELARRGDD